MGLLLLLLFLIRLYELFVNFRDQSFVGYIVGNIFSHSVRCLFILLMILFTVQKVLSLVMTHLFIFFILFIIFYLFSFHYSLRQIEKDIADL